MILILQIFSYLIMVNSQDSFKPEFDFIVVGAGSAGATVASRLSENSKVTVLLLEAGDKPPPLTDIPILSPFLTSDPLDWHYQLEPQPFAFKGFVNKQTSYPRGKCLGGSSSINGMIYVRGNRMDYELWAANGATGWSYNEVLPYFMKSEGNKIKSPIDKIYHNLHGPLTVETSTYRNGFQASFLEAAKIFGFPTRDINGDTQRGFTYTPLTLRNGYRCSTVKAFLGDESKTSNLKILTGALVTKVIFNKNKIAQGVLVEIKNKTIIFRARKEVILSAGVINSPQILMLSGVGPKEQLHNLKIPLVMDLPVGLNFHDHIVGNGMFFKLNNSIEPIVFKLLNSMYGEYVENLSNISNYDKFSKAKISYKGKLSDFLTSPFVSVIGFLNSKYETIKGDYNDLMLNFIESIQLLSDLEPEYLEIYGPYVTTNTVTVTSELLHPRSRGNITLKSTNPHDAPIINLPNLQEDIEVKIIVEGFKLIKKMMSSKPMKKFNPELVGGPLKGCENFTLWSDDYLECQARTFTLIDYHGVGTCKMGAFFDSTTVVDPFLRVKGLYNIRVVDASVMPRIISGNTNAPTIMIAEKAADMIKKDYGLL